VRSESEKEKTCNLCSGKEIELYRYIPRLNSRILRCRNCNLVFLDPTLTSFATFDFENQGDRQRRLRHMTQTAQAEGKFDEAVLRREEKTRTSHFRNRKEEIERYVNPENVLDIGCGRGFFLANYVNDSADYLGIEPREDVSEDARKRVGKNNIFCGTLQEANLPREHFNVVTMINLIEHLPNPMDTLREVNRVMKKDGLLFVETPNVDSIVPKLLGHRWHGFQEHEHHYFFSEKTLGRMLAKAGFAVRMKRRGDKLFSVAYLIFRIGWYSKKARVHLEKVLSRAGILRRTIRMPQVDELIFVAQKSASVT